MGVVDFYNEEDHRPPWCDVCGDFHVDAGQDCDRI
tara:strand:- start:714 stop:818 length:105 start_codon:yes stop_codon:yes gene_type:complete